VRRQASLPSPPCSKLQYILSHPVYTKCPAVARYFNLKETSVCLRSILVCQCVIAATSSTRHPVKKSWYSVHDSGCDNYDPLRCTPSIQQKCHEHGNVPCLMTILRPAAPRTFYPMSTHTTSKVCTQLDRFETLMRPFGAPEIVRVPLEELVLQVSLAPPLLLNLPLVTCVFLSIPMFVPDT
jgi:hypothetical protein